MIIENRRYVRVPDEYIRSFEIPDGLPGPSLCEAIKEKIGYDWSYLDLPDIKLRNGDLRRVDLYCVDLSFSDLRGADLDFARLNYADVSYANFTAAKNVNFSGSENASTATHARIIEIPEIKWDNAPIAAIMPEGKQPLLLSIGFQTHSPEVWKTLIEPRLDKIAREWFTLHKKAAVKLDKNTHEWFKTHKKAAIKKAYELAESAK
jgi:hypothetical protein